MSSFYLFLWLKWVVKLSVWSLLLACGFSFFITLFLYVQQGMPTLNEEIRQALLDLFLFWFSITWNVGLLSALFISLKYIFNSCNGGYMMKLLACGTPQSGYGSYDIIENIGYGDLVKIWRKWFMLLIWLVGTEMILALSYSTLFTNYTGVFEWFDIYWLFGFVLVAGFFSFILLGLRCKRIKVVKC